MRPPGPRPGEPRRPSALGILTRATPILRPPGLAPKTPGVPRRLSASSPRRPSAPLSPRPPGPGDPRLRRPLPGPAALGSLPAPLSPGNPSLQRRRRAGRRRGRPAGPTAALTVAVVVLHDVAPGSAPGSPLALASRRAVLLASVRLGAPPPARARCRPLSPAGRPACHRPAPSCARAPGPAPRRQAPPYRPPAHTPRHVATSRQAPAQGPPPGHAPWPEAPPHRPRLGTRLTPARACASAPRAGLLCAEWRRPSRSRACSARMPHPAAYDSPKSCPAAGELVVLADANL